jgi:trigger factor
MLRGDLRELDAEGNTKEGGLTVESALVMPSYIKADDQKAIFNGAKLGDVLTFNPRKAYADGDTELAALLKISKEEVAQHEATSATR